MKIKLNSDTEKVERLKKALKENEGYCPCYLIHSPETKCRCAEFREQVKNKEEGFCHCGLFYAEREEND